MPASASGPLTRLAAPTRCQSNRKRTKSRGSTGSISRRSRFKRVAVDAREQMPLAPLGVGAERQQRREAALQHRAFASATRPGRARRRRARGRAAAASVSAVLGPRPPRRARSSSRSASSRRREACGVFGRRLDRRAASSHRGRASRTCASRSAATHSAALAAAAHRESRAGSRDPPPRARRAMLPSPRWPRFDVADDAERDQRLVHLVGVARARPGLVANARRSRRRRAGRGRSRRRSPDRLATTSVESSSPRASRSSIKAESD